MSKEVDLARVHEMMDDAWLRIPYTSREVFNPLENIPEDFIDEPHLYIMWLLSNPEYFSLFCGEILGITILPFQAVILEQLWNHRFPILIGSRGLSKSYLLALYAVLRMVFMPGRKVIITGAGFRQSKVIFEYIEKIWYGAPIFRDMVGDTNQDRNGPTHGQDLWRFVIGESQALAIPIGTGEKIRGQRAHDILMDEFAVGDPLIFEHVISGFGCVASNVIEAVQWNAKKEMADVYGIKLDKEEDEYKPNQIVLSGTAYYSFNHFYRYWKQWKDIILSEGNKKKLIEAGASPGVDWKDYSIIRLPYNLLPKGFMEEAIIERSKGSMHESLFSMEYFAQFASDSNGFFKRSLIEKCVDDYRIKFDGDKNKQYVIAVDPASENDNFCIVVLEVEKEVRRIVNCWTTTRKNFKEEVKKGNTSEDTFYDYAARKILDLCSQFNVIGIAIDSQGGGHPIIEQLHSNKVVKRTVGELPIWKFVDKDDPKEEDGEAGKHIIEVVNFSSSEYTSNANHGLRKDFETRTLLFPKFDGLIFAEIDLSVSENVKNSDIMEEGIIEIEELKNELSSIVMSQTPQGRDRWDTPEQKLVGSKKGRMRKDRYSALLMANALAKKLTGNTGGPSFDYHGGFIGSIKREEGESKMFTGGYLASQLNALYGD